MVKPRILLQVLVGKILFASLATWAVAADGFALLNRMHVGRVKAVDPSEGRLVVEGMFHDRSFREIPVVLEPDAAIISPEFRDQTRRVGPEDVRPGHYVALECAEEGKRHTARKITITSTGQEERSQRALMKRRRTAPAGLRGVGGVPR